MPSKAKGKKTKEADDDEQWEANAAVLDMLEDGDDDDGGGLLGTIQASKKKEKKRPEVAKPAAEAEEEEENNVEGGPTVLSKSQKEKLKKEREKAKKKAQAAAKKIPDVPAKEKTSEPIAEVEEDDEEEAGAADDKKKKKKKKPAAKPIESVASVAKGGKKQSAHILAMQAAMEEKKRLEEEARRREEERLRAIEEEEARIAAEAKRVEDQKLAKKAREKEKQAKAKAEGRLLTPAQKKEKAAAEARKQAMLASGMKVAGLQGEGAERKKPVTGRKKLQKASTKEDVESEGYEVPASPMDPPVERTSQVDADELVVTTKVSVASAASDDDDDWDKSEDEAAAVEGIVAGIDKMNVGNHDRDRSDEDPFTPSTVSSPALTMAPAKQVIPAVDAAKVGHIPNGRPASTETKGKVAPPRANGHAEPENDSSEDETSSEEDSEDESSEDELVARKSRAMARIQERQKAAEAAKSKEDLRSPICCILGHVDTGKTKLLDKIRQTSVQEGEAGGITQQIGATFFPRSAIEEKTAVVNKTGEYQVQIPGLLIIDTPGHESFTNLRSRGSSLCNIAILVVDITHGLEPQTIESLNLLKNGRTPFIVALNKIDRMYGWKATPNGGFRESLAQQAQSVRSEFEDRVKKTKLAFAEQGLNAEIFDENKNLARTVSLVPTSAITGEGIPDMLMLLVKLTQERMNQSLMFISELECTILEVKIIEGLGTTIDVILSNGVMREGDKIVLCGTDGPIVTNVRALLTPQPLREMRVKSAYVHHKEVKAALGVKISAPGLEKSIAGARLYVAEDDDEVEAYKDLAMQDVNDLQRFASKGPGVWVQASTLGSLEALLQFLQQMKIPVRNFAIGPVFRSHVIRSSRMLDVASEYALILAFDVPIDKDAREFADKEGVKIFSAMIIYHLFDAFKKYMSEVQESRRQAAMPNAVWPVRLSIIKAFAHRDPIVLGVDIIEGSLRTGTPVGVVRSDKETGKRDIVVLGKITSIEINHKTMEIVKKAQVGAGAAVKIERAPYQAAKLYGRHFDDKDEVVSLITRQSIDTLKTNFRDQVDLTDWAIIKKMKVEQGIS